MKVPHRFLSLAAVGIAPISPITLLFYAHLNFETAGLSEICTQKAQLLLEMVVEEVL